MNPNNLVFLETQQIVITPKHIALLDRLSDSEEHRQSELRKLFNNNKTITCLLLQDLLHMGWIEKTSIGSEKVGNIIVINKYKLKEIESFLGWWKFLKRSVLVRPHKLNARGLINAEDYTRERLAFALGKDHEIKPTIIRNNTQYIICTPVGKIVILKKSPLVEFWIDSFILPVNEKDLEVFESYITDAVMCRLEYMIDEINKHTPQLKIHISSIRLMNKVHMGILEKKNARTFLKIQHEMKDLGFNKDKSIGGCFEHEVCGSLEEVLSNVAFAINRHFEEEE